MQTFKSLLNAGKYNLRDSLLDYIRINKLNILKEAVFFFAAAAPLPSAPIILTYAIFFQKININPHLKPIVKIEDSSYVQNNNTICNKNSFEKIFSTPQCMCFTKEIEAFNYSRKLLYVLTVNTVTDVDNNTPIEYFNVCWAQD